MLPEGRQAAKSEPVRSRCSPASKAATIRRRGLSRVGRFRPLISALEEREGAANWDRRRLLACLMLQVDEELFLGYGYRVGEPYPAGGDPWVWCPEPTARDRDALAEIGRRSGRRALEDVARITEPDILIRGRPRATVAVY